jgi:15-cis-phytoene synthase
VRPGTGAEEARDRTARDTAAAEVRAALAAAFARGAAAGWGVPAGTSGQAIRPLLSLAGALATGRARDDAFWAAAAAVQLAHEASLLHDDVIDGAATRRSEPTLVAARGVAVALVEGDHLLTTGYRFAAASGSPSFMAAYAQAVERTVAGEKLQGRSTGVVLDEERYRAIVGMKSGELLGIALAAAPLLDGSPAAAAWYELGRRIGTLYQMLDDLLDYCPDTDTGKPALGDWQQRRWTWPLLEVPDAQFGRDASSMADRMATPDARGSTPLHRCRLRFDAEAQAIHKALQENLPGDVVLAGLIADWSDRVRVAVERAEAAAAERVLQRQLQALLVAAADGDAFFRRNSRSFSFAARLFPEQFRQQVTRVYAFCRITDDLADAADGAAAQRLALLDLWERLARRAHEGGTTGFGLLDQVMHDAAAAGVPFRYVEELIEGMRMDIRTTRYETLEDLRVYSYRVAGVVGQWLTRLVGVHDEAVLDRAASLGHAMQLTNIIRDVGEDLQRGRIYVPASTLRAFGVTASMLRALADGDPVPTRYRRMLEHLMACADTDYRAALEAVPALPRGFRLAVVVAADVYRGIHDAVRANEYDNIRRRAVTGTGTKFGLAGGALLRDALRSAFSARPEPLRAAPGAPAAAPREHRDASTVASRLGGTSPAEEAGAPVPATRAAATGIRRNGIRAALLLVAAGAVLGAASAGARAAAQAPQEVSVGMAHDTAQQVPPVAPAARQAARLESKLAAAPDDTALALDLARALFFTAVDEREGVARGRRTLAHIRQHLPGFARSQHALLLAYDGAFDALDARHGTWPHARLIAVRSALRRLDAAVAAAPDDIEVRYLRLVNTHFLPGFFGRRDSARADRVRLEQLMAARAHATDRAATDLPPGLHAAIVGFLQDVAR